MLLADVVEASAALAATRSRTQKLAVLTEALRSAHAGQAAGTGEADAGPGVVEIVASYLAGILPQRRVGVGWRSLATLPSPAAAPTLSVLDVDEALTRLHGTAGAGSAGRRAALLHGLFARATAAEADWLRGLLTGGLRQGALDGLMLQAVARAADVPEHLVRRAVMLAGYTAPVAQAALMGGADALRAIGLRVGRPLRPMLAASAPDVASALAAVSAATPSHPAGVETKLDGIRIQVHLRRGAHDHGTTGGTAGPDAAEVAIFTRTLDDVTDRMPEVVEAALAWPAQAAVVDGEAIALRPDGRPHPFQVTGARTASRTDPGRLRATTPLTPFFFDALHVDGVDLLDEPGEVRWDALTGLVAPEHLVPRVVTHDPAQAEAFLAEAVAAGHEGVVVKSRSGPYAAGRRGAGWVKVKPRHTLDLVVVAVEWGSGRRRGRLSNIHLAARGDDGDLVMLGKTFKGMTDEMLAWQTARFLDLETHREGHVVHVRPEQVVEIAFDGLQVSRRYPGGLALRFARVLRYRDDKTAEQADTLATVRALAAAP